MISLLRHLASLCRAPMMSYSHWCITWNIFTNLTVFPLKLSLTPSPTHSAKLFFPKIRDYDLGEQLPFDGVCAHYVMVSKIQWKPFWLATKRLDWVAKWCEQGRMHTTPISSKWQFLTLHKKIADPLHITPKSLRPCRPIYLNAWQQRVWYPGMVGKGVLACKINDVEMLLNCSIGLFHWHGSVSIIKLRS